MLGLDPSIILDSLAAVGSFYGLFIILVGVTLGIVIGAIPGMSPAMGVALMVPFSYNMEPIHAFLMFISAYQAANYGGSITAIAINTPGTPASIVSAIDGYALTKLGQARTALGVALFSSVLGGLIGTVILIIFTNPIARGALAFGPAEYFSLAVFGLSTVVGLQKRSFLPSLIGVFFGLLISTIGVDPFSGESRYTFDIPELFDGVSLVPALIGLFALGEIFSQQFNSISNNKQILGSGMLDLKIFKGLFFNITRSSIIGTLVGVIPGAGATVASFISYGVAQKRSQSPKDFGKGSIEGLSASEAANSSSVGGALIPLIALGIPGSATDAVLLGALTLHGLVAGPALMQDQPILVYSIFLTLIFANLFIFVIGFLGNSLWLKLIKIPQDLSAVLIGSICVIGSYIFHNSLFDVYICFAFGLLGWLSKKANISPAAIVLGLILGPLIEQNLRRALLSGSFVDILTKPIAALFLALTLFMLASPLLGVFKNFISKRQNAY